MAVITTVLKKNKINKKGLLPIYLRVAKGEKTSFISTGIKVMLSDWDIEQNKVKRSAPNATRINAFISQKISELENKSLELELRSQSITSGEIKDSVITKKELIDFFAFAQINIDRLQQSKQFAMHKRVKAIVAKMKKYTRGQPLHFSKITVNFLNDYESYLSTKLNNRKNTIHANFRVIRKLINDAIREDIIQFESNPFLKFKMSLEKTTREFLTEEELRKVENLNLNENEIIFHHRNVYVFSAYAGGLRISDLLLLRWKNFDTERISFQVKKTGTTLTIKLPLKALEILRYYKSLAETTHGGKVPSEAFIFPLIRVQFLETNDLKIHTAISSATTYGNASLKTIADTLELGKHISWHSARHLFAIRALKKGMRIEYVSKIMGHSELKTTQIYAKIVDADLELAMSVFDN